MAGGSDENWRRCFGPRQHPRWKLRRDTVCDCFDTIVQYKNNAAGDNVLALRLRLPVH